MILLTRQAGVVGQAIGTITSNVLRVTLDITTQAAMAAAQSYTTSVSSSYISATFDAMSGKMDWSTAFSQASKSWSSVDTIAGTISAGVMAATKGILGNKLNIEQEKYASKFIGFSSSVMGEAAK
jgi:hypothetical protein